MAFLQNIIALKAKVLKDLIVTMAKTGKVCFFVKTKDSKVLKEVNFYSQDIDILEELGYEVIIITDLVKLFQIKCDIYFVWWWTYAFFPLVLSKIRRKRFVVTGTFNIDNPQNSYYDRSFLQRLMIKTALKYADANILVSEYELDKIKEEFGYNNLFYVPHIVDIKYHIFDKPIFPKEKFFLSVSWLQKSNYKRKCIDINIKAIGLIKDEISDYKYIIVGRYGDGVKELKSLVKDLGIENIVEFKGSIPETEKISLMQRCSVYLSPTFYEGFGLAMLEAISCGAVLISTKTAAVPFIFGEIPVYVEKNTPDEIAKMILKVISEPDMVQEKSTAGMIRSKKLFAYSVRFNGIRKILEKYS